MVPTKPPARTDGRRARTAPPTTCALRLGDEDARLRQVDELAEQIGGIERARATGGTKVRVAQGDETIDIRDTGCSDQVFHAEGFVPRRAATVAPRPGHADSGRDRQACDPPSPC